MASPLKSLDDFLLQGKTSGIQLNYGEYSSDFQSCKGYYINVANNSIVFL